MKGAYYAALAGAVLSFGTEPAVAQTSPLDTQSGNGLLDMCTSTETSISIICSAFVNGVEEGLLVGPARAGVKAGFCPPDGVTHGQTTDIVVAYLRSHPEIRQMRSSILVSFAMDDAWPCTK